MPTYASPDDADNGLHQLLLRAVPENDRGNKTLTRLAELVPCTRWAIQKWIIAEKIAPDKVVRIVEIGKMEPDGTIRGKRQRSSEERRL